MRRTLTAIMLVCTLGGAGSAGGYQTHDSGLTKGEPVPLVQARKLRAQHELQKAQAVLQQFVAQHPDNILALTLSAEVDADSGDVAEAERILGQVLQKQPDYREANLAAGNLLLGQKHFPEAMDRFETVLANVPHDAEARKLELEAVTNLAAETTQAGNPEAALKALRHASSKMPDDAHLLMELGLQALELKLFPEAEEALQTARRVSPSDPDITYSFARLYLEEQHMPQAEAELRKYLAARPNDASAHFGLGRVLAMLQRDEDAKAEFLRSTQLQPKQTESYYQIGQIDLNAHRNDAAAAMFQRVLERDPKHGGALVGAGEIAFQAKDYTRAEEYLRQATAAAPDYGPGHYYLGLTLSRLGKKEEAKGELQIATQLGKAAAAPVQSNQSTPSPQ